VEHVPMEMLCVLVLIIKQHVGVNLVLLKRVIDVVTKI
jgi:hypothetical protein